MNARKQGSGVVRPQRSVWSRPPRPALRAPAQQSFVLLVRCQTSYRILVIGQIFLVSSNRPHLLEHRLMRHQHPGRQHGQRNRQRHGKWNGKWNWRRHWSRDRRQNLYVSSCQRDRTRFWGRRCGGLWHNIFRSAVAGRRGRGHALLGGSGGDPSGGNNWGTHRLRRFDIVTELMARTRVRWRGVGEASRFSLCILAKPHL